MNYLAHAYLSFQQEEILAGNMISDYVKGKKQLDYAPGIQKGIRLHRAIDTFTDYHAMTRIAKQFLKPAAGLYAGAFIDVVYDHFLATDKNEFPDEAALLSFSAVTYRQLATYEAVFPERFQRLFPSMQQHNWLYHYRSLYGIRRSMEGLAGRALYLSDSAPVYALFEENYEPLQACYQSFFPELKQYVQAQLALL